MGHRMKITLALLFATLFCLGKISPIQLHAQTGNTLDKVPTAPELVKPLKVGDAVPEALVKNSNDKEIDLKALVLSKPTVLIFFRGGWCPYCSTHLREMAVVEPALISAGYQLLALSPDSPEKIRRNQKQNDRLTLLSDSKMNAAKAFGLAYKVDEETVYKFKKEHKIDLEADSGETHHLLPVPASFIIGSDGRIVFAYSNPNYKTRMDPGLLLEKAQEAAAKK